MSACPAWSMQAISAASVCRDPPAQVRDQPSDTLGARSYPLLQERLGLAQSDLKRLRHAIVPSWWEHETEVRDFRLTLDSPAEQAQDLELSEWITDASLRRAPFKITLDDQTVHELVPDGIFTLAMGDGRSRWPP